MKDKQIGYLYVVGQFAILIGFVVIPMGSDWDSGVGLASLSGNFCPSAG